MEEILMKCPGCGRETNAKICESCGTSIESTTLGNSATPIAPAPKKPFYKKWWFWVIIGVVVVGMISNAGKVNNTKETAGSTSTEQKQGATENKATSKPTETKQKADDKQTVEKTPAPVSVKKVEWKQFLKEYEEWVDSYVALVKKYKANSSDVTLLSEYTTMMQKLVVWSEKADKVETELKNNSAALKEYLATLARVVKKLSSVY